jgi:hypothetical protein
MFSHLVFFPFTFSTRIDVCCQWNADDADDADLLRVLSAKIRVIRVIRVPLT